MIHGEEKPPLAELAHYGVMGMKWGQRRSATASDIRAARGRVSDRNTKIKRQERKVQGITKASERKVQERRLDQIKISALKNPDRVIAARMTRGEKAIALIGGGIVLPGAGILPGAAVIAGTSARSRRIEQLQDERAYDRKKS